MGEQHQYGFFDGCGHRFARYLFACFSGIGATRVENRHQEENPNRRQRPHTFPGSAEAALPRPDRVPGKLVGRQTRGRRVPPQAGESSFGPELRNGNGSAPRNARGGRDPHNFGIRVCAGEAGCHTGASPAGRIGLFTTESCVRDEAARPNPKAPAGSVSACWCLAVRRTRAGRLRGAAEWSAPAAALGMNPSGPGNSLRRNRSGRAPAGFGFSRAPQLGRACNPHAALETNLPTVAIAS